jgi:hypothetical protein
MTNAQRQARYRLAQAAARPVIHYRRAADRRSRAQRWGDAVAELVALQSEYARWFEALPDPLHDTATGEALPGDCRSRTRRPARHPAAARLRTRLNAAQLPLD